MYGHFQIKAQYDQLSPKKAKKAVQSMTLGEKIELKKDQEWIYIIYTYLTKQWKF